MGQRANINTSELLKNKEIIKLLGNIDCEILNSNKAESLYYSLPLIERIILEIYKLVPESNIESIEQGIMRTPVKIIEANEQVLPKELLEKIKTIYQDNGLRNKIFHPTGDALEIKVDFCEINKIILQLLEILIQKLETVSIGSFKEISFL